MMRICEGNKSRTAEPLGIALKTLYNKLKIYESATPDSAAPSLDGSR